MKKTLMIMLALVLVIAMSVSATLAYLTDNATVTNTFTVGDVQIDLDETKVDVYGVKDATATAPVKTNTYKLIPGHSYLKDPTVHVKTGSEECWLFVKVVNGLGANEITKSTDDHKTIADQMAANGWTLVPGTEVYAHSTKHVAGENVAVFTEFTVAGDATLSEYGDIVVTAYAIQADGFDTAAAAWTAAGAEAQENA